MEGRIITSEWKKGEASFERGRGRETSKLSGGRKSTKRAKEGKRTHSFNRKRLFALLS